MGYTTDFDGSLKLSRPATEQERDYINLISATRRMKRDVNKLMKMYEGKHGYPFAKEQTPEAIYGRYGEFFAYDEAGYDEYSDESVIDHNLAPGEIYFLSGSKNGNGQPGLWCQWVITNDGKNLEHDGGEKFYNYIEWLQYLIKYFFEPWGIKLNGEITWEGEESSDIGKIVVANNMVTIKHGRKVYY